MLRELSATKPNNASLSLSLPSAADAVPLPTPTPTPSPLPISSCADADALCFSASSPERQCFRPSPTTFSPPNPRTKSVQTQPNLLHHFENILRRDAHFRFLTKTKEFLSKQPEQVLRLDDAGKFHQQLGFPRGRQDVVRIHRFHGRPPPPPPPAACRRRHAAPLCRSAYLSSIFNSLEIWGFRLFLMISIYRAWVFEILVSYMMTQFIHEM